MAQVNMLSCLQTSHRASRVVADTFETNHHVYGFERGSSWGLEKARSDWRIDNLLAARLWTEVSATPCERTKNEKDLG
jgi:hypothetical protein